MAQEFFIKKLLDRRAPQILGSYLIAGTRLVLPGLRTDPKTYITTVGLYYNDNELLAIAKLSKPILKSKSREALIKVKLDF